MNDDLTNILLQRQLAQNPTAQQPVAPLPTVPPSTPSRVPPEAKRWANTQQIQQAYKNPEWTPNPVLLRAMLGHR